VEQALAIDIRSLRINKGLSVADAAKQIGISRDALARAESAERVPQPRNAFAIAEFYGYKVTQVWPLEDPVEDEPTDDDEQAAA
jgi:transcriptional regulator with XRE-family HTH domain